MVQREKNIFILKCEKCRCKNSMEESQLIGRMRKSGDDGQYAFYCYGCSETLYVNKEELPRRIRKKIEK